MHGCPTIRNVIYIRNVKKFVTYVPLFLIEHELNEKLKFQTRLELLYYGNFIWETLIENWPTRCQFTVTNKQPNLISSSSKRSKSFDRIRTRIFYILLRSYWEHNSKPKKCTACALHGCRIQSTKPIQTAQNEIKSHCTR